MTTSSFIGSAAKASSQGTALITGASRGIGAIYADRLAKRGYELILVARDAARLTALSSRLARATQRTVTSLPANLADTADLARVETALREDHTITMLVNNAGTAVVAPLQLADVGRMDAMIALNVTALMRLTYAAAPAFIARGSGTIINIGSLAGLAHEFGSGPYGATKAFVLAFSQSLQHELAENGIRIQVVLPGVVATDLWELAGFPYQNLPASMVMSLEDLVDAALVGLDLGELVTSPGLHNAEDWFHFEAERRALAQRFGNAMPAPRYRTGDDKAGAPAPA